jgi:hypothetical protein
VYTLSRALPRASAIINLTHHAIISQWPCLPGRVKSRIATQCWIVKCAANEVSHPRCLHSRSVVRSFRSSDHRSECPELRQRHRLRPLPDLHEQRYWCWSSGGDFHPLNPAAYRTLECLVILSLTLNISLLALLSPTLFVATMLDFLAPPLSPAPMNPSALLPTALSLMPSSTSTLLKSLKCVISVRFSYLYACTLAQLLPDLSSLFLLNRFVFNSRMAAAASPCSCILTISSPQAKACSPRD